LSIKISDVLDCQEKPFDPDLISTNLLNEIDVVEMKYPVIVAFLFFKILFFHFILGSLYNIT
jgi:hypothetical protein